MISRLGSASINAASCRKGTMPRTVRRISSVTSDGSAFDPCPLERPVGRRPRGQKWPAPEWRPAAVRFCRTFHNAGRPHMQFRLDEFLRRSHRLSLTCRSARRAAADLALAVPDRGERRRRDRGLLKVVIAGDGDVDAGHQPGARDTVHQADGDQVVPADRGSRLVLERQELPRRLEPGLLVRGPAMRQDGLTSGRPSPWH